MTESKRFYDIFQPTHYAVYLDIDRAKKTIQGVTTIAGTAQAQTIQIHQKDLVVEAVQMAA